MFLIPFRRTFIELQYSLRTIQPGLSCRISYWTACFDLQHVFHTAYLILQNVLPYSLSCPAFFSTVQHVLSCSMSFIQPVLSCCMSFIQPVLSCSMSFIQPVLSCRMSVIQPVLSCSMSFIQPVLYCRMSYLTACLILPPSLPYSMSCTLYCLMLCRSASSNPSLFFVTLVLLYSLPASLAYSSSPLIPSWQSCFLCLPALPLLFRWSGLVLPASSPAPRLVLSIQRSAESVFFYLPCCPCRLSGPPILCFTLPLGHTDFFVS